MPLALGFAAFAILLDQFSKWVILTQVMQPPRVIEVTGFFNLVLGFNRGVSFGLFSSNSAWTQWILSALALAVVVGLLVWLRGYPGRFPAVGIGLIVGGAIGNVIDRVRLGGVVDFLDFYVAGWHWPAFNLGDSSIFVGVALLIFDGLFLEPRRGMTQGSGKTRDKRRK